MHTHAKDCCVLNGGKGSWAFQPLALQLSTTLGIPISTEPRRFNYLLYLDSFEDTSLHETFIPIAAIRTASDKRRIAEAFHQHQVPSPRTILLQTYTDVAEFLRQNDTTEWCLKFPTGCGANGHRIIAPSSPEPPRWPPPFIVQEFIRMEHPEVYRIYCTGTTLFGWNVRRFPTNCGPSPWVAHARGARYERAGEPPKEAIAVATAALEATGLYTSFGCVDLLLRYSGEWVALEVGTDGLFNHIDRNLDDLSLEAELSQRISETFWKWADTN